MLLRRASAALGAAGLLLLLAVVALTAPGSKDPAGAAQRDARGGVTTLADQPAAPPAPTPAAEAAVEGADRAAATPGARAGASDRWRVHELRRLRRSRTVPAALRRAWLARRIDARTLAGYRGTWARAQAAARRLDGPRAAEQRAAVGLAMELARGRELTSSRLPAVLLTLRRNTNFWTRRGPPRPKQRFAFGRDPVVFRYEPGQGLQIHWLGTWGRENGRARFCLEHEARCPKATVRAELERLAGLASRRAGYSAYEAEYRFGGGGPTWVSGMTQGTAVQALSRGRRALDAPQLGLAARRALGAFEHRPPAGVAVRDAGRRHYLMYSFSPGLRILNGDLQAITGLRDMARLTGSRRAGTLYRSGERWARAAVRRYDTGAWSLYSAGGSESTLHYHRLVDGFLANLCARTRRGAYCGAARRFARYEREPVGIVLAGRSEPPARRPTPLTFALSKRARVLLEVRGVRGLALRRVLDLPRGPHEVVWSSPRRGRYRVTLTAQGVSGPSATRSRAVRVIAPPLTAAQRAARRRKAARQARAVRRERAQRAAVAAAAADAAQRERDARRRAARATAPAGG